MNKLLDIFAKGKRKKENCCTENIRDGHTSPKVVFKFCRFDSDRCGTIRTNSTFGSVPEQSEESRIRLYDSQSSSPSRRDQSFMLEPKKNYSSYPDEEISRFTKCSLPERKEQQYGPDEKFKFKKELYVIRINNSKSFHIGPQRTIDIYPQWSSNNGKESEHSSAEMTKLDLSKLLDSEKELSEDNIALISVHLEKKWKEFGRNLGLKESFLEDQEMRHDGNGILIAYDILHRFISLFPNTSLGFVIYMLSKNHCIWFTKMLAQKLESNT